MNDPVAGVDSHHRDSVAGEEETNCETCCMHTSGIRAPGSSERNDRRHRLRRVGLILNVVPKLDGCPAVARIPSAPWHRSCPMVPMEGNADSGE